MIPAQARSNNYLPPHLAMDPEHSDLLTMRRKQLLDVLEQTDDPSYSELAREMIAKLDFERGFFILQHCMGRLRDLGDWEAVLRVFQKKHGKLAAGVAATLEEGLRRDGIKNLRSTITEPEHRFFLALLMNLTAQADLLALVKKRFPKKPPVETVLRWAEELIGETDTGIAILDAEFPEVLDIAPEAQPEIFLAALRLFMMEAGKKPQELAAFSDAEVKLLTEAFATSSLRVLGKN